MNVLVGDTTGNGIVNSSDISQTKDHWGGISAMLIFVADVTADGMINSSDVSRKYFSLADPLWGGGTPARR